jgi:CYTH domain-containing protein
MLNDRPRIRRYARIELERRFLLEVLPPGVKEDDYERMRDVYVHGTHLRVRHIYAAGGEWITTKLGQKIPNPRAPDDPRQRQMTTIYLPREEIAALEVLDGLRTVKRRYRLEEQGRTWCVDVWEEPIGAAGVIVSEVEADTIEELEALTMPVWAVREVTDDRRYSAIALAQR